MPNRYVAFRQSHNLLRQPLVRHVRCVCGPSFERHDASFDSRHTRVSDFFLYKFGPSLHAPGSRGLARHLTTCHLCSHSCSCNGGGASDTARCLSQVVTALRVPHPSDGVRHNFSHARVSPHTTHKGLSGLRSLGPANQRRFDGGISHRRRVSREALRLSLLLIRFHRARLNCRPTLAEETRGETIMVSDFGLSTLNTSRLLRLPRPLPGGSWLASRETFTV